MITTIRPAIMFENESIGDEVSQKVKRHFCLVVETNFE